MRYKDRHPVRWQALNIVFADRHKQRNGVMMRSLIPNSAIVNCKHNPQPWAGARTKQWLFKGRAHLRLGNAQVLMLSLYVALRILPHPGLGPLHKPAETT